jgi:S-adenosylmethionine:tRNA ribosyltransferase-isomerase
MKEMMAGALDRPEPERATGRVPALDFPLPSVLEAGEPPEARGLDRDEVRLMVSSIADDSVAHTRFRRLPERLSPGDLLVINTSGTMSAALPATRDDGEKLELHLSTRLPDGRWIVELRRETEHGTIPFREAIEGERLTLPAGGSITLLGPHGRSNGQLDGKSKGEEPESGSSRKLGGVRLWEALLDLPGKLDPYLARHGAPIRYGYVRERWPIEYYQTVYATETGSAEMPSAGRAFTPEIITRLVTRGVRIAPLILHTGVASLEEHEPPYEEYYRVPAETAELINLTRWNGKRVIAVGTTVVRAVETLADRSGFVDAGEGWTDLVITPELGIRAIDGLLTGLHESRATHLAMLAALAGEEHLRITYNAALRERYLWHEFGDLHLILP